MKTTFPSASTNFSVDGLPEMKCRTASIAPDLSVPEPFCGFSRVKPMIGSLEAALVILVVTEILDQVS